MQLRLAVNGVHSSNLLSDLHLLSGLHHHILELAVEREIVSVLDKHALIIAGHHEHLLHDPVEHTLYTRSGPKRYADPVVLRQLDILINRMIPLSESIHNRTVGRPRQFALVLGELGRQLLINHHFVRFFACAGGCSSLHRFAHQPSNLPVKGFHLLPFCRKFLLVLRFLFLQLSDQRLRLRLLALELSKFFLRVLRHNLLFGTQFLKFVPFCLQLCPGIFHPPCLLPNLRGETFEIAVAAVGLRKVIAREYVHIPYSCIAVLVGPENKPVVMCRKRVVTLL